ncbi:uncharacterized protein BYT42DRAFT_618252 [Radiomyces spectabilis]|uniref:uncharacterized protein n=1 Tax=Radiomyces spectabilis TaxID=64574 RepID=UPI00221E84E7|nr:uncharacterized protein BYT42DRAFT_618252 [Radiomyces spectabilis]KAI8366747.1 hypothetical protein BYT42DRAFT_618252 [Radiomyces spectabilis]
MSSVSWMAEKSSKELIPMLKNAYTALKNKERDLLLAAEIGKSLLENNIKLKTSYEDLLHQSGQSPIAPLPTPSSSLGTSTGTVLQGDSDSGIESSHDSDPDDHDLDEGRGMRFIPSRSTREAMIEVLERKNAELTDKLQQTMHEQSTLDRANARKIRECEAEITMLKNDLDIAATKIAELEEMNRRQKQLEVDTKQTDVDDAVVNELLDKIHTLEHEKQAASHSKAVLEDKLAATLKDLCHLKQQVEDFQFTQKDHESLQEAYQRQFHHIAELNDSLEEHRIVLQKLRDRGIPLHSTRPSPAPSQYGEDDSSPSIRPTLLAELENEWLKKNLKSSSSSSAASSAPFSASWRESSENAFSRFHTLKDLSRLTERSLNDIYNFSTDATLDFILSRTSGIDKEALDDAIRYVARMEDELMQDRAEIGLQKEKGEDPITFDIFDGYPREGLYPELMPSDHQVECMVNEPRTFMARLRKILQHFFHQVWRWCRFAMILTAAIVISLWNGPDCVSKYD